MSSPLKSTLFWGAVFSTLLLASPEKADLPRIPFIPNRGQWHSDVLFLYRTVGMEAWGTHYGLNLTFYQVRGTMDPFWASVPVPAGIEARSKGLQILGHSAGGVCRR